MTGTLRRFAACFGDGRILKAERTADNNGYLDRRPDGRPDRRLDRERNGWPNHKTWHCQGARAYLSRSDFEGFIEAARGVPRSFLRVYGRPGHPYSHYTSKDYAAREMENLWPHVWQMACREEHIAEPGDYQVYDIGHLSAIVTRTESMEIKAYVNACMHRGTALKPRRQWFLSEFPLPVSWLDLFPRW